jgi:hypothetical protein
VLFSNQENDTDMSMININIFLAIVFIASSEQKFNLAMIKMT